MDQPQTIVVLLACLVLAASTTSAAETDLYEEPSLAEVLADPEADGYDRTFSMCQVEAKEFQATVRSTAYRVLKGVCNPGELEKYLDSMEERFNQKLDDFVAQISSLIRQNIGTEGSLDTSAATGVKENYISPGGAVQPSTSWKAETAKQHAFGKTKRSHSKHLKHATLQNDKWSRSPLSEAEERRLAVQNLLPGGRHGSSGSTLFKTAPGVARSQRDWPALRTNSTPTAVAWGSSQDGRNFQHKGSRQFSKKSSRIPDSSSFGGQYSTVPVRHLGRGQHVTDTISYISPRQSALASRYPELRSYNDTVYYRNGKKIFTYYWKIENFGTMMTDWSPEQSLRSPSFYVYHGGYRMFLRLFPRWNGDSVLIRAALTSGRHDRSLPWPFRLPLRVSVLDHSAQPDDLQSRLWRPQREPCPRRTWHRPAQRRRQGRHRGGHRALHDGHACLGLSVPHALLNRRRALLDGALLVKLDVFLDGDGGARRRRGR
ncbi:uncharacterized protein LOC122380239 [Amphibalanus amphitrite]|uniref:uncharacterized protein LOC122380239 n=1 Tax=Amphibalanus amphitrite TaxID=1232801 RepID=UPI001C91F8E6|nr:uncharacterized protein LOC122380239 [Amphibalanus amphitrite]